VCATSTGNSLRAANSPSALHSSKRKQALPFGSLKHVLCAVAQASSMTGLSGTVHAHAGVKHQ
jgi:hypothetical protein